MLDRPEPTTAPPQVVTPQIAAEVKRILADVPIRGTAEGTGTRSSVWNIFGKTGTSHISTGRGGYSDSKYNSSFLGGAPAEHPRLVIAMIVHEPEKSKAHYGGWVAAPGASRVLQRSLAYLQIPASPDLPMPPPAVMSKLVNFDPKQYDRKAPVTNSSGIKNTSAFAVWPALAFRVVARATSPSAAVRCRNRRLSDRSATVIEPSRAGSTIPMQVTCVCF